MFTQATTSTVAFSAPHSMSGLEDVSSLQANRRIQFKLKIECSIEATNSKSYRLKMRHPLDRLAFPSKFLNNLKVIKKENNTQILDIEATKKRVLKVVRDEIDRLFDIIQKHQTQKHSKFRLGSICGYLYHSFAGTLGGFNEQSVITEILVSQAASEKADDCPMCYINSNSLEGKSADMNYHHLQGTSFVSVVPLGGWSYSNPEDVAGYVPVRPNISTCRYATKKVLFLQGDFPAMYAHDSTGSMTSHSASNFNFHLFVSTLNSTSGLHYYTYHASQEYSHIHIHQYPKARMTIAGISLAQSDQGVLLDIIHMDEYMHRKGTLSTKDLADYPQPIGTQGDPVIGAFMARLVGWGSPLTQRYSAAASQSEAFKLLYSKIQEWGLTLEGTILTTCIQKGHWPVSSRILDLWTKNIVQYEASTRAGNLYMPDFTPNRTPYMEVDLNIKQEIVTTFDAGADLRSILMKFKNSQGVFSVSREFLRGNEQTFMIGTLPSLPPYTCDQEFETLTPRVSFHPGWERPFSYILRDDHLVNVKDWAPSVKYMDGVHLGVMTKNLKDMLFKYPRHETHRNRAQTKLEQILEILTFKITPEMRFLDLCAGEGSFSESLLSRGLSGMAITLPSDNVADQPKVHNPRLRFFLADVKEVAKGTGPLGSVDIILADPEDEAGVEDGSPGMDELHEAIYRIAHATLKPGGLLIMKWQHAFRPYVWQSTYGASRAFEHVIALKPCHSSLANSELYIAFMGRKLINSYPAHIIPVADTRIPESYHSTLLQLASHQKKACEITISFAARITQHYPCQPPYDVYHYDQLLFSQISTLLPNQSIDIVATPSDVAPGVLSLLTCIFQDVKLSFLAMAGERMALISCDRAKCIEVRHFALAYQSGVPIQGQKTSCIERCWDLISSSTEIPLITSIRPTPYITGKIDPTDRSVQKLSKLTTHEIVRTFILPNLEGETILDLNCGDAQLAEWLYEPPVQYIGIDPKPTTKNTRWMPWLKLLKGDPLSMTEVYDATTIIAHDCLDTTPTDRLAETFLRLYKITHGARRIVFNCNIIPKVKPSGKTDSPSSSSTTVTGPNVGSFTDSGIQKQLLVFNTLTGKVWKLYKYKPGPIDVLCASVTMLGRTVTTDVTTRVLSWLKVRRLYALTLA